jgi:hypothetical protein
MAIRNTGTEVTLTIDQRVVATARCSQRAAADGNGVRIVSTPPAVVAVFISRKHAGEMVTPVVRAQVRWMAVWRR